MKKIILALLFWAKGITENLIEKLSCETRFLVSARNEKDVLSVEYDEEYGDYMIWFNWDIIYICKTKEQAVKEFNKLKTKFGL